MLHPRLLEVADEAIRANIPVRVRILDYSDPGMPTGMVEAIRDAGYKDGEYFLEVEGFYKTSAVALFHTERFNSTDVFERYERQGVIGDGFNIQGACQKLAEFNYSQWMRWKDRGYTLDQRWAPLLVKHGFIRAKVTTTYEAVTE